MNTPEYKCIDAYKSIEEISEWTFVFGDNYNKVLLCCQPDRWKNCPNCGLKPKVWEFNNGRSTACGCGRNRYDHFSIHAESITSYINRKGPAPTIISYDRDELLKNWNYWVDTGVEIFEKPNGGRPDGRW